MRNQAVISLQSTGLHHRNGSQASSVQESRKVQKVYYHWFFRGWHFKNDVALLKLVKPVKLSDKVNMVCLPKNGTVVKPGTECYITGKTRGACVNLRKNIYVSNVCPFS